MRKIEASLVELIGTCLQELRTCNPGVADADEEEAASGQNSLLVSNGLYDSMHFSG